MMHSMDDGSQAGLAVSTMQDPSAIAMSAQPAAAYQQVPQQLQLPHHQQHAIQQAHHQHVAHGTIHAAPSEHVSVTTGSAVVMQGSHVADVVVTQQTDVAVATAVDSGLGSSGVQATQGAVQVGTGDAQYLDMVWQMSDLSLHDKTLPAPPAQQPPAPPASHIAAAAASGTLAGQARGKGEWGEVPNAGSGPANLWNSFDDAAAKGMVDGLVGGEDGVAPLVTSWNATHSA